MVLEKDNPKTKYFYDMINDLNMLNFEFDEKELEEYFFKDSNKISITIHKKKIDSNMENIFKDIVTKYKLLYEGNILNDFQYKLSDLDIEMIKNVPPGGNWKSIPYETAKKSKRLLRIIETGGRTTLYGRIDYDTPSYTITTYFNRPGNGTYVHPTFERVLTTREAARLQSFPDDFYFVGNQREILTQIGNAVPPLFSYQIGKNIKKYIEHPIAIDLFSGAGGITFGFKKANIKSILATDISPAAIRTLQINNPEIPTFVGDITNSNVKDLIVEHSEKNKVNIISGGPPCQGFSLAGLRLDNDPRNKLFLDFIEIVERVKPKLVIFENVPGILSSNNGKTFKAIINKFNDIGYKTDAKTVMMTNFGVPQRRKRVFIISIREDILIEPNKIIPAHVISNDGKFITSRDAIYNLENKNNYFKEKQSIYSMVMNGSLSFEDYLKKIRI